MTTEPVSGSHVVIVGGGISGLAAAYYLQKAAQERSLPLHFTLLESSSRTGGKLFSESVDGYGEVPFIVEGGPDCFITQKPWAMQLAEEIGIGSELMGTNDERRKVWVLNKGRPTPMPDGVLLIVPTKFMPFALSPLISPMGKLRMGMDLFIAPKTDDEDETLAQFITRRLGNEALDKIAEPLMSGIYNAEADRQSVMATFPRFRAIEKEHGSLIRGMLASRNARAKGSANTATSAASAAPAPPADGRPKSIFVTFKGGTQQIAAELRKRLASHIKTDVKVTSITLEPGGRYRVEAETPTTTQSLRVDAVVLATPAYVSAQLLQGIAPSAASTLERIRYVSTGTISLAYRSEDVHDADSGFGLVIPMSEQRPINAITFSSTKFDRRAPDGYSLVRVFFGGSRSPKTMELDDDTLVGVVRAQLQELLAIDADPLFHRIYRWHRANPQYDIGHLDRVAEIEEALPDGIVLTGSAYRGVGIPDCVHQAQQAVDKLLQGLPAPSPNATPAIALGYEANN